MTPPSRPTIALVNLDNLRFNLRSCRSFLGPETKIMAVVKADAYGHGAVPCARVLESEGIDWFGVATPEEGIELRTAGISRSILSLGGSWSGQEPELIAHKITPVIYEVKYAELLNNSARDAGVRLPIHVKIDTGMGRLGVRWDAALAFAEDLSRYGNLSVEGIMTHFASADDPEEGTFTALQVERFRESLSAFYTYGHSPRIIDLSNSPGAIVSGNNGGNMVRLGGVLYGLDGDVLPPGVDKPELRPVMSLKTTISHLKWVPEGESIGYGRSYVTTRPSRIAALPVGYYDGYRRALSNASHVIVNGAYAPVVGRISMDWITADVTDVPNVDLEQAVLLIGEEAACSVKAEDLAKIAKTISYEITCGISRRVPRNYIDSIGIDVPTVPH